MSAPWFAVFRVPVAKLCGRTPLRVVDGIGYVPLEVPAGITFAPGPKLLGVFPTLDAALRAVTEVK